MMHPGISITSLGLIPGHLLRGISAAWAEHRSWDAALLEERSHHQANEFRPDGPAEPCVCIVAH